MFSLFVFVLKIEIKRAFPGEVSALCIRSCSFCEPNDRQIDRRMEERRKRKEHRPCALGVFVGAATQGVAEGECRGRR